ncbi:hypothetical protein [Clostridium hydrogeniformans]|uniref:hypothetical protein n=1 Tax=Clostridium hydrogeniformans TaxID=349933 RepID=UPI0004801D7E|nr:hypothetical protein [Clostridium hydrogeniformans]
MKGISTVKDLVNYLNNFEEDMEVRIQQIEPVSIYRINKREINIYKYGKVIGKKTVLVIC